jgi:hypothetical protein
MPTPAQDPLATLAANLDRLMRAQGLTPTSLGDLAGLDCPRVGAILAGQVEANAEGLIRLAGAFKVEPTGLVGRGGPGWERSPLEHP